MSNRQAHIDIAAAKGFANFSEIESCDADVLCATDNQLNIQFAIFPPTRVNFGASETTKEKILELWHQTKSEIADANIFENEQQLCSYLDEFGPPRTEEINAFAIALKPLLGRQLRLLSSRMELHCNIENAVFGFDDGPGLVDAFYLARLTKAFDFEVPSCAQWELAVRGNNDKTLFFTGDDLESLPSIVNADLHTSIDVINRNKQRILDLSNEFGVAQAALCCEWCSDLIESDAGIKGKAIYFRHPEKNHCVKGITSDPGTWQHTDSWVDALIALFRGQNNLEQPIAAFRPIVELVD